MIGEKRRKGISYERRLVDLLWKRGFACIRGGASGAGSRRRFVPDVVAMKSGVIFVFEVKVRSDEDVIYIDVERIEKLMDFAKRAGGRAFIAVKYGGSEWRFVPVEKLQLSSTGSSYKIDPETVKNSGLTIKDLERLYVSATQQSLSEWVCNGHEGK